jgi:hypothetical protein
MPLLSAARPSVSGSVPLVRNTSHMSRAVAQTSKTLLGSRQRHESADHSAEGSADPTMFVQSARQAPATTKASSIRWS